MKIALALLALLGACATAPPPVTTALTQVEAEELVADLGRIAANKEAHDAIWAKFWGAENAARIQASLADDVQALVATAAAESRPVGAAEILALVQSYDQIEAAAAKRIADVKAAAADDNIAVAAERAQLLLDYVSEISERERMAARVRASLGITKKAQAAATPKQTP